MINGRDETERKGDFQKRKGKTTKIQRLYTSDDIHSILAVQSAHRSNFNHYKKENISQKCSDICMAFGVE